MNSARRKAMMGLFFIRVIAAGIAGSALSPQDSAAPLKANLISQFTRAAIKCNL
jgi:hypothetical protein